MGDRQQRYGATPDDSRLEELQRAHARLQNLYQIGKLLTRFHSVERTLSEIVEVIGRVVPLRTLIFIVETGHGAPRTLTWQARGSEPQRLWAAKERARNSYGYLVRSGVDFGPDDVAALELPARRGGAPRRQADAGRGFILLPLAVDHGAIFGALQIESDCEQDEQDLFFLNAVVNQLAIAVARHAAIRSNQARVEAGEREQRLLAGVSEILASCLEYRSALASLAEFVVSFLADICVIDEVTEDGSIERLEVLFVDKDRQRAVAERVRRFAPKPGWQTPQGKAAASGESILISSVVDPLAQGIAHDAEHADTMRASGITSMMVVPLRARGSTIGVLTLCSSSSERHFSAEDLGLVEEIARRSAVAIDNARLYQQAQRATVARDNLVAVVSHDLRNALSVISIALSAQRRAPEEEERRKSGRQLAFIRHAADGMNRLIHDLLQTASLAAGQLELSPRHIEAAPLILRSVEMLRPLAAASALDLRCDLPDDLPAVCADSARIDQVLANLVGNAIKFTPKNGSITIAARRVTDGVQVAVTDTGPGIPPEHLPHLFDRFWQAERHDRLGTGLGLYIVKGIVEGHGGRVWVESELGRGASFFFTLPLAPSRRREAETRRQPEGTVA